jgi:hypothetical protein
MGKLIGRYGIFMNFLILCLSVKAQRVSDVIVVQDGQKLRIQYLLSTTVPVDVDLYVSDNNGVTWQEVGDFLSGSYGQGISSGRKEIIWDVLQSKEKLVGNSFVFKVKVGSEIRSVKIGNQVWMAENLNVDHYQNGEPILLGITYGDWSGRYVETIINDTQYQRFYNWFAVNDSRGLCPTGWHVPSHYEYLVLEKVLGGSR